jgi:pSer/pThr/pTyr-binding forkhead associated (FHA) protein
MHVMLTVVGGVHKGRQIPVAASTFLIGRAPHCQLRPLREDVSREHCAIVRRGERVFLRDDGSSNGTILNRQYLVQGETPLAHGDTFEVGPLRFQITISSQPIATKPATADDDSCFDVSEIYAGLPGEREPSLDKTIEITRPNLVKPAPRKPLTDEIEKMM